MRQEIIALLKRLRRGHELYQAADGNETKRKLIFEKAEEIFIALEKYEFPRPVAEGLLIFGGSILKTEFEEFMRGKEVVIR